MSWRWPRWAACPPTPGTARTESLAGLVAPVSAVQAALAELAQDGVADHAAQADAVVRGHVSALAEVPQDLPGERYPSEHDRPVVDRHAAG